MLLTYYCNKIYSKLGMSVYVIALHEGLPFMLCFVLRLMLRISHVIAEPKGEASNRDTRVQRSPFRTLCALSVENLSRTLAPLAFINLNLGDCTAYGLQRQAGVPVCTAGACKVLLKQGSCILMYALVSHVCLFLCLMHSRPHCTYVKSLGEAH